MLCLNFATPTVVRHPNCVGRVALHHSGGLYIGPGLVLSTWRPGVCVLRFLALLRYPLFTVASQIDIYICIALCILLRGNSCYSARLSLGHRDFPTSDCSRVLKTTSYSQLRNTAFLSHILHIIYMFFNLCMLFEYIVMIKTKE